MTMSSWWQSLYTPYADTIEASLAADRAKGFEIYPPETQRFRALEAIPSLEDLRVVLVGQDPYIHEGEADGLCFSVPSSKMPPSLRNIFKELQRCYGKTRTDTDLSDWATQGVLMLNRALSVRQGSSNSHRALWLGFTDAIVRYISQHAPHGVVFMLWGNDARSLVPRINDATRHCILEWTHPSPLSRQPFVGCNHFVLCNVFLEKQGKHPPIHWV